MKKLACPILLLMALFGCFLLAGNMGNVHASTNVGGLMTSNTTWTQADSPYKLIGPVGVEAGVTLTIVPGVEVDFGIYYLQVNGTLDAQGTSSSNIFFSTDAASAYQSQTKFQIQFLPSSTSWYPPTASGCVIENSVFNATSVSILGCSPEITRDTFTHPSQSPLNVLSGSPSIVNNDISAGSGGSAIIAAGSPIISNNFVHDSSPFIYGMQVSENASVENNVVNNCWQGIQASGEAKITGNTITNCKDAAVASNSASVIIEQNYMSNNGFGVTGIGVIRHNAIINNNVGIKSPAGISTSDFSITIKSNNIQGSTQNSIYLTSPLNVDATDNWWGTTDSTSIKASIYDNKDDFNLGTVTFNPILSQADSQAPSTPLVNLNTLTQSSTTTNPTNQPATTATPTLHVQPTSTQGWLSSIGSSSSGPENSTESVILKLAETVPIVLAVGWAIVIFVVVRRRLKRKARGKQ